MLRNKKRLFLNMIFAGILAFAPGCGGDSSDDGEEGDGGGEGTGSLTVNVTYTGAGTVNSNSYIFCTLVDVSSFDTVKDSNKSTKAMDIPPFCQIFSSSGSCTMTDIESTENFLMIVYNKDASSAFGSDVDPKAVGPMSAGDSWVLYDDMDPADVFADMENNIPIMIDPAETENITVTLTDDYIAEQATIDLLWEQSQK